MRRSGNASALLYALVTIVVVLIFVLLFLFFDPFGRGGGEVSPTTALPSAVASGVQKITIESPTHGATVSSPIAVSGRTDLFPFEGNLNYRLFGPDGNLLTNGALTVTGEPGGPSTFSISIPYALAAPGAGRLEILELSGQDGSFRAMASVQLNLGIGTGPTPTSQTTATAAPAGRQQIIIDSPPPGTQVGSPVVLTGRTALLPRALRYFVRDPGRNVLGSGEVPFTSTGSAGAFNASLTFNLPPTGGQISVEIYEPGPADAPALASASISLNVAPPQGIVIETPPVGTTVGSPVVITGRTARYPFQGNLGYRVLDANNRQIGAGSFQVSGSPGGPSTFSGSLTFSEPASGGTIKAEIFDQDESSGQIVATASINLNVAPPQQAIIVDTPPPGTEVGSPVVLTGRVVRFPNGGQLGYRVRDASGNVIGQGSFGVQGSADGGTTFTASLTFSPPPNGGPITIDLLEQGANNQVISSTSIGLSVAGPRPPTPTTPRTQQIFIDTPPPGTTVGSPLVITGRVALYPFEGNLSYRVRDTSGNVLGQSSFQVSGQSGQVGVPFNASLTFSEPAQGGNIQVEIFDQDEGTGAILASSTIMLRVNPRTPTPTTGASIGGPQQITIETPPPDTTVGSPVVITGRLVRAPAGGQLYYKVVNSANTELGAGSFSVPQPRIAGDFAFVGALTFNEPAEGGEIVIEISDRDLVTGQLLASVTIQLYVEPQP